MEKFLFGFEDNGDNFFDGKTINTMNTMASALVFLKDNGDNLKTKCGTTFCRSFASR